MNSNIELKVVKFEKGVTTAGDTWNDSAYDTIETPSELTYEFDGCKSHCSEIGATKEELIAKAIKTESWNEWFYEMEGEYKTFQEVGLESPMVFVPEEDCDISVDGIGDFINNGKGLCPKTMYLEVKEQLFEIALNAVEITVVDENGEEITSQFSSQKMDGKIICKNEIENEEFEEFDVNFKIVSNKNENVYCEGYVTINDEEAEDVDWYYWTGNGYQSRPFYHHNKEEITGLTDIQNSEIDTFREDYSDDALWIDTCILQSEEDENRTFVRENCTLIINGDD